MAKITITIEDNNNGGVSVVSDPTFETMAKMDNSGFGLTSAHGYALSMINVARKVSKQADVEKRGIIVEIPKALKI